MNRTGFSSVIVTVGKGGAFDVVGGGGAAFGLPTTLGAADTDKGRGGAVFGGPIRALTGEGVVGADFEHGAPTAAAAG